jgi:hypothetical protein
MRVRAVRLCQTAGPLVTWVVCSHSQNERCITDTTTRQYYREVMRVTRALLLKHKVGRSLQSSTRMRCLDVAPSLFQELGGPPPGGFTRTTLAAFLEEHKV